VASIRASYLVCILDDYSRLAWAEVMQDITALTTMFAALRCMQALKKEFGIHFEEMIADMVRNSTYQHA
jgi:hypothetical protein